MPKKAKSKIRLG